MTGAGVGSRDPTGGVVAARGTLGSAFPSLVSGSVRGQTMRAALPREAGKLVVVVFRFSGEVGSRGTTKISSMAFPGPSASSAGRGAA